MLLNELWEQDIDFADASFSKKLEEIETNVQHKFKDCQFKIIRG